MTLDYFYGQSGELFSYFRIPKALFQDIRFRQLSTDARTLYGILLDRMSLIYVKDFTTGLSKMHNLNCANSNSGVDQSAVQEQTKPQANKD